MAWVWFSRLDTPFRPAEFDHSSPVSMLDSMSSSPINPEKGPAIFHTKSTIKSFEKLHCPPVGNPPAVDKVWQDIILQFVPKNQVQFYPIEIHGKDGVSHKFSWVIPLICVRCIDIDRSDIVSSVVKSDITYVISAKYFVHHQGCLGGHHLARDEQKSTHIVLSDELRNALAETGESSVFFRPEKIPTIYRRTVN